MTRLPVALALLVVSGIGATPSATSNADIIAPNDNRRPAGRLANGVLTVRLEARSGIWRPERSQGPIITTAAFAEEGKAPENPGPLLRVPAGTEIRATVRNSLLQPMWLFGMGAKRGIGDSVAIAVGAVQTITFRVTEPGAYYYVARTVSKSVVNRNGPDSQLGGLIIVDSAGVKPDPRERFFAITMWGTLDPTSRGGVNANSTFAFNGQSWPRSERFELTQGDSAHWRFVNISSFDHPLHLHGFYFRVNAKGDGVRDTLYAAAERRMAVTEYMAPFQTMALSWSPDRSGNWIFHCHFAGHIAGVGTFDADRTALTPHVAGLHGSGEHRMRGLVFQMTVKPRGAVTQADRTARPIRLIIRSKAKVYGSYIGYSYALGGTPAEQDTTMKVPGPVLELTRGERVAINIVNKTHEGAAVHWHGIELESYPDGVPGVSGEGRRILPMIPAGDSLTVTFTPPRAGTFMYHSHSNEFQQIASGLYGAIIVREPGVPMDPNERLVVISDGGPIVNFLDPKAFPRAFVNGSITPDTLDVAGGAPARVRLISIRAEFPVEASLLDGDKPVQWRIIAKDGMTSTPLQSAARASTMVAGSGEIYDLEVVVPKGAVRTFRFAMPDAPPQLFPPTLLTVRGR
ncbi:MAG: multicopper oxidase domain-containing protein [Gemmatimonadaceae bacterium]